MRSSCDKRRDPTTKYRTNFELSGTYSQGTCFQSGQGGKFFAVGWDL